MKSLKSLFIVLFFLVSVSGFARIGKNHNYTMVSQGEYLVMLEKNKDVASKKYVVIPFYLKGVKDIGKLSSGDSILAACSYLLKKGKTDQLLRYLEQCDTTIDANLLVKTLYYFSIQDYKQTLHFINISNFRQNTFLKILLLADCNYELLANKKEYDSILVDYSNATSTARTLNDRNIVRNRLKIIAQFSQKK